MSMDLCISVFHPRDFDGRPFYNHCFGAALTDGKPYYLLQFPSRSYMGNLTFITMGGKDCLILEDEHNFICYMCSLKSEIASDAEQIVFDEKDQSKLDYCINTLNQISANAHQWYQENKVIVVGYC